MAASETDKPTLQTDAATPEQLDVVETPTSPSSGLALSRFEFETGKGNEGTKILMVEWDTAAVPQAPPAAKQEPGAPVNNGDQDGARPRKESATGNWEVTWEGKTKVLAVRDRDADSNIRRVYFLLPPGSHIPPLVSIAPRTAPGPAAAGAPATEKPEVLLRTKPMPAIFPPALGGSGSEAGRRGVLHTLWARKRLAELQAEITDEMKSNGESVGLEMAMQERQWIVDHFGLAPTEGMPRPTKLHIPAGAPVGPASPRSPIGGKLGEKLRGLKLATSPVDLAAAAVAAKTAPPNADASSLSMSTPLRIPQSSGGIGSLNAIVDSSVAPSGDGQATTEEELFALPMSPRSPDMSKSPFSLLK